MRLIIDAGKLKHPNNGLDTFLRAYISEIENYQSEFGIETHLLLPQAGVINFSTTLPCIRQSRFKNIQARQLCKQFDLWHTPFHTLNKVPNKNTRCLHVSTIHDFNPLHEKPHRKQKYLKKSLKHLVDTDFITCISKFTNEELRTHHPELAHIPSEIIYNGVDTPNEAQPPASHPNSPFLFSLGAFMRKKNYECIVKMMPHISSDIQLIIAGSSSGAYIGELQQLAQDIGVSERVKLLANISSNDKNWYLRNCSAFLFPSKLEGFGLPPAEAMKCGKTPFIFKATSVPEVVGNVGQYWTDEDPEKMASLVNSFIAENNNESPETVHACLDQAKKFSWDQMTQSYLALFKKLSKQ